jgi:hypothetical protein
MISRRRDDSGGGTDVEAADLAITRGMADVLCALDNVIDDDAALRRVYAALAENGPAAAGPRGALTAVEAEALAGVVESAASTSLRSWPAASRRRLAARLIAALVATALAGGSVALRVIGAPGASHPGADGAAEGASYVISRVSGALRAAENNEIGQLTVATHGAALSGGTTATTTSKEWSHGDQWRSVTDSSAGRAVYDEGSSTKSVYTLVSYPTHTWAREPGLGHPAAPPTGRSGCQPVAAALPLGFKPGLPVRGFAASLPLTVAGDLRTAISCGTLAVAGRQRVDGVEAIELTSSPDSAISETIWVSPRTYLPVRVAIGLSPARPRFLTADIGWLPLSAQNLAKLAVAIPTGFRRVRLAEAITPISTYSAG